MPQTSYPPLSILMHADCALLKQRALLNVIMQDLESPLEKSGYRPVLCHSVTFYSGIYTLKTLT